MRMDRYRTKDNRKRRTKRIKALIKVKVNGVIQEQKCRVRDVLEKGYDIFSKPIFKLDEVFEMMDLLIERIHNLYIEKQGDKVSYEEIIKVIKETFKCDHCIGASMGDCEICEEVRSE